MRALLALLFWLVSALPVFATNYYTATAGNGGSDSNDGLSQGAPKLTIHDVLNDYTLAGGDVINVGPGTHTRNSTCSSSVEAVFCLLDSGSSGNPIIIQATEPCVMDGTDNPSCPTVIDCNLENNYAISGGGGGDFVRITGFEIANCTHDALNNVSGAQSIEFIGNYVHDIATTVCSSTTTPGRSGMYFGSSTNYIIAGNVFRHIGRLRIGESGCAEEPPTVHLDHGLYFAGSGHRIYNNIFSDITRGDSIQIYDGATGEASDIDIFNNTFRDSGNEGTAVCQMVVYLQDEGGSNIHIKNNLSDNTNTCFVYLQTGHTWSDVQICENQTDLDVTNQNEGSPPSGVSFCSGSNVIDTDPEWEDGPNGDFRLQSTSPAIDVGDTLALVTEDIVGTGRPSGSAFDRGAYEFVGAGGSGGAGSAGAVRLR